MTAQSLFEAIQKQRRMLNGLIDILQHTPQLESKDCFIYDSIIREVETGLQQVRRKVSGKFNSELPETATKTRRKSRA